MDASARLLPFLPFAPRRRHHSLTAILPHPHLHLHHAYADLATMPTSALHLQCAETAPAPTHVPGVPYAPTDAMRSPVPCCDVLYCALPGAELLSAGLHWTGSAFAAAGERGEPAIPYTAPYCFGRLSHLMPCHTRTRAHSNSHWHRRRRWPFSPMAVPVVWPV